MFLWNFYSGYLKGLLGEQMFFEYLSGSAIVKRCLAYVHQAKSTKA
ncbi:hypothetical protein NTGHW29_670008 [Candidatus Nitrotoga sp. HW29]|nr:hypothetical protein NTGHW29_670008 [Candidatus Nitrotoga sp. HW29]